MDVVYAYKISSMDDEYIHIAAEAVDVIVASRTPGMFWIDYVPLIKYIPAWIPGAAAKKFGARTMPVVLKMFNQPFDVAKERAVSFISATYTVCVANHTFTFSLDFQVFGRVYRA